MKLNDYSHNEQALLREEAAAQFLGFTTRALQAWRIKGCGPTYVKISSRAIRYRPADLIRFAEERIRRSTSEHKI